MKLDLQSLFGLHVCSCTHWLRPRNPRPPPLPPHLGSYTKALLVSQGRRHIFFYLLPIIVHWAYQDIITVNIMVSYTHCWEPRSSKQKTRLFLVIFGRKYSCLCSNWCCRFSILHICPFVSWALLCWNELEMIIMFISLISLSSLSQDISMNQCWAIITLFVLHSIQFHWC